MKFKEGQTYICIKSSEEYWTEGKEYEVTTIYGIPALPDNNGNKWTATALKLYANQFKLKEKENKMKNEKVTLDELNQEALEKTYTPIQVRDAITKAYLAYDNDAQRLAFLQGYFSK